MTAGSAAAPPSEPIKVLLVDDDALLLSATTRVLKHAGYVVTPTSGGESALEAMADTRFDVVCTDIGMPGLDGIALLRAVRERDLDVPVVLFTGAPSVTSATEAIRYGAIDYVSKPLDRKRLEQTLERAVRFGRLARAKREARGDSVEMHGAGDRAGLEALFASAIRTLFLVYQPVLRANGALFGYEALLRCREPAMPHPGAVLDAAEKLGRLGALGRRLRTLAAEPIAGSPAAEPTLFVNLHPHELFDPDLTDPESALARVARHVVLEITERASLGELDNVRERVLEIRDAGYRIAIDDLGAGYAGLTAFALLEPDIVKLDMSLVRGVEESRTKQRLIASMTNVSHELGIQVVAEGIETESELDAVLECGCDYVQGYLFARPGPPFPTPTWPTRKI